MTTKYSGSICSAVEVSIVECAGLLDDFTKTLLAIHVLSRKCAPFVWGVPFVCLVGTLL